MKESLIVANWKMNPATIGEAKRLFNSIEKGIRNIKNTEVVVCMPFVYLPMFWHSNNPRVKLGAQDVFWEEKGAYTGEISSAMLKNLGVEYVIIGHSERRKYQNETDEMINKKIRTILAVGLKPILCIEKLSQLKSGLKGISEKIIIAYEPIFAIGTGKPCSVEMAKKMRNSIKYPVVLYGGSVNSQNATEYIKKARFRGLLVGGASLNPREFITITKNIDFIRRKR